MWKIIPINDSNGIVFDRFDAFYNIAKAMKGCHTFYLSKEDSMMYGINEEFFCIRYVPIQFDVLPIPASLVFKILSIDAGLVEKYKSFVFYPEAPWMMLPTINREQHKNLYNPIYNGIDWLLVDNQNNPVDFINLYSVDNDKQGTYGITVRNVIDKINQMKIAQMYLSEGTYFGDKQNDPLIQEIFANKASMGAKYMRLTGMNGKNYGFMIFKNLFNMNKSDNLTIVINDRLDNINLFQVTFITRKKKSPLPPDVLPIYTEFTTATFVNI